MFTDGENILLADHLEKRNDRDSSGHLAACIAIMQLSGFVLRLSINSFCTSARHRTNVDNGGSVLLTKSGS